MNEPVMLVPRPRAKVLRWLADQLDAGEDPLAIAIALQILSEAMAREAEGN